MKVRKVTLVIMDNENHSVNDVGELVCSMIEESEVDFDVRDVKVEEVELWQAARSEKRDTLSYTLNEE